MAKRNSFGQNIDSLIETVDAKYPSPEDIAAKIWEAFPQTSFSRWEIFIFCVQYLTMYLADGMTDHYDMYSLVRSLNARLHYMHYVHAEEIYGLPKDSNSDSPSTGSSPEPLQESEGPQTDG